LAGWIPYKRQTEKAVKQKQFAQNHCGKMIKKLLCSNHCAFWLRPPPYAGWEILFLGLG
jgi:hypothetical protein